MAAPQRPVENRIRVEDRTEEPVDGIQSSLEKCLRFPSEDKAEIVMLRSRINEQSSLICILTQRADDLLVKYQGMQKINSELKEKVADCQEELDNQIKQNKLLETRFMDLADNNKAIIAFMEEYKNQNAQLKVENTQLQAENDNLFCQKLQDKEAVLQNLRLEIKQLSNKCTSKETEYRKTLSTYQANLLEQASQHQVRETSLLNQLHKVQQEQKNAAEMSNELKLKLQNAEEYAAKEVTMKESITNLTKEKEALLSVCVERGRAIQEKQQEIQHLREKLIEEKNARFKAEERFEQEAEFVDADIKVKTLQSAFDESITKYEELMKDFEAFKNHSANLLKQEKELNSKLRHMLG